MPNHGAPVEFLESILKNIEAESGMQQKLSVVKQAPKARQKTQQTQKNYKVFRELYFDLLD